MSNFANLLGMIDASQYAESVCDHAAWVAGRCESNIELMHVIGRRGLSSDLADLSGNIGLGARSTLLMELSVHDEENARLAQKRGRLLLDAAEQRLSDAGMGKISTRMRNGEIVDSVLKSERNSDILIIGKRGEGADFDTLHPGSNLERVARLCTKPVLVTARAFRPINRILVAFDGGKSTLKAVNCLISNPLFSGAEVKLLTVATPSSAVSNNLAEAASKLVGAGYAVKTEVVAGQPETAIPEEIERHSHDLLVMGAYGHSRIRSMILGSTTTVMIASCKISVMLFR